MLRGRGDASERVRELPRLLVVDDFGDDKGAKRFDVTLDGTPGAAAILSKSFPFALHTPLRFLFAFLRI